MKISLIVAMARNRAIGLNGQMPWHLSADLKHFKKLTLGSPIIMGRKTFEAIGRPLPGRRNLVISRSGFQADGVEVFASTEQALQACEACEQVFIIGGATLYEAFLEQADYLYLTAIDQEFAGDTFFPAFDRQAWREVERQDINNDPAVSFGYSFLTLERLR